MKRTMAIAIAMFVAACGGGTNAQPTLETNTTSEHHEHEHGAMTPEVEAFHDAIRPVWHGDPATRGTAACTASATLTERAQAVAAAAAPAGAGDAWASRTADLVARAQALSSACSADPNGGEAAIGELHEAFHALLEAMPAQP